YLLPQPVAEEAAVPQQQQARAEVAEQPRGHGLLAALLLPDAFDHQGQLGAGADLDQAELADLGEGALAAAALGAAEGQGVGGGVSAGVDRAVEGDHPPALVEGARGVWPGQGSSQRLKEQADGCDAQALARPAQAGAVGRLLRRGGDEAAAGLEQAREGQGGGHAHGQDEPEDDLEGQGAAAGGGAARVPQALQAVLAGDNLPQQEQPVQHPLGLAHRQRACPMLPARRPLHGSLLGPWCPANPSYQVAATYVHVQRYWV